jgi:hypothetical protein
MLVEIVDDSLVQRFGERLRGLGYRFLTIGRSTQLSPVTKLKATGDRNFLNVPERPSRKMLNHESYVMCAARCLGLVECAPHISRIELVNRGLRQIR